MANDINLKVGMDGEKELKKGIADINRQLKTLDLELKKATAEFESNADSQEALDAKSDILNRTLQAQQKKVEETQKVLAKMSAQYGENSREAQDWNDKLLRAQRDLYKTENSINNMNSALNDTEKETNDASSGLSKLSSAGKGLGGFLKSAGAAVAAVGAAITGAIAGINNLAESTRELRTNLGKLDTSFTTYGHTAEEARETYSELYGILGDSDQSVEAANNISKIARSQKDLTDWTRIATGVFATFGDGIPIESLTEAANETQRSGQLTGALTDSLVWAGVNEEKFQERLDKCNGEQERNALITSTLNKLYGEAADKYRDMNGSLIEANKASANWEEALAGIGGAVEPVSTALKNFGADILTEITPAVQTLGDAMLGIMNGEDGAADQLAQGLGSLLDTVLLKISEIMPVVLETLGNVLPAFLNTVIDQLPAVINSGVDMIFALADGIVQNLPALLQAAIDVIVYLADALSQQLPTLIPTTVSIIMQMVETLTQPDTLSMLVGAALTLIVALAAGLVDAIPEIVDRVPQIIENIIDAISRLAPMLLNSGIELIGELVGGIIKSLGSVGTAAGKIVSSIWNAIKSMPKRALQWGKDLIDNIARGIRSAISRVTSAVQSVASKISSFLHFSVPDEGPLVDAPKWMPDMIDLMTKGIRQNESKVEDAARSLAEKMRNSLVMNANLTNVGSGRTSYTFSAPVYLDGKKIADNTQRYITSEQRGLQRARGHA